MRKVCANHIVDFRIPLEKLIHVEHEMFEDVQLIGDELRSMKAGLKWYILTRKPVTASLTYLNKRMRAILICLKEWNCSDKRKLH